MTSLRLGLCVGLLAAAGCPATDDTTDTANDTGAMTTNADTGPAETTAASADVSTGGGSTDLSHAVDIQPIWDEHCLEICHEPDGEWGFLLDMSGDAYAAIVNVPSPQFSSLDHIEPGDPERSYLWHKINNTQASVGGSGLPMPKARAGMAATVMTQAQKDMIEEWILGGAPP